MSSALNQKPRILLVDDETEILNSYKYILGSKDEKPDTDQLDDLYQSIFGETSKEEIEEFDYDLVCANQGSEAVDIVKEAKEQNVPFSVVFLDMRMPPGQNGFITAQQIRRLDIKCNIVIVTAYSDVEVSEMANQVKPADKFFYLRKPFHPQEIQQFAVGLSAKWNAEMHLDAIMEDRMHKLAKSNIALHEAMDTTQKLVEDFKKSQEKLSKKEQDIESVSRSMELLFRKKFEADQEVEDNIIYNINNQVMPFISKLKGQDLNKKCEKYLVLIENNIKNIASPFMANISLQSFRLTPDELNVAQLISQGMTSQKVAEMLNLSKRTIDFHRDQLRKKLGIHGEKKSLKNVLKEMRHRPHD